MLSAYARETEGQAMTLEKKRFSQTKCLTNKPMKVLVRKRI
jgi:hypothetical protein